MPPKQRDRRDRRLRLLDRGTEPTRRLRERAEAYAHILPTNSPRKPRPARVAPRPTARRAEGVTAAFAYSTAPITVAVWSKASTSSVIAELRVTARPTSSRPTASSRQGFAQRPKKWRRWESNPRPQSRDEMASTSVAGALVSPPTRLAGGVAGDQLPEMSPARRERTLPGEPAI